MHSDQDLGMPEGQQNTMVVELRNTGPSPSPAVFFVRMPAPNECGHAQEKRELRRLTDRLLAGWNAADLHTLVVQGDAWIEEADGRVVSEQRVAEDLVGSWVRAVQEPGERLVRIGLLGVALERVAADEDAMASGGHGRMYAEVALKHRVDALLEKRARAQEQLSDIDVALEDVRKVSERVCPATAAELLEERDAAGRRAAELRQVRRRLVGVLPELGFLDREREVLLEAVDEVRARAEARETSAREKLASGEFQR